MWKDFDIESQVEVSLSKSSLSVEEGSKATLTADVILKYGTDSTVSWSSSNSDVASVNSGGEVTGRKAGEADVTVTTNRGGVRAVCHVTVKKAAAPSVTVSSSSYSQLKISWSKVRNAADYEVWRAKSSSGSYVKLKTLSSSYYKVRAYRKVGSKYVYSAFSAVKSYKLR